MTFCATVAAEDAFNVEVVGVMLDDVEAEFATAFARAY